MNLYFRRHGMLLNSQFRKIALAAVAPAQQTSDSHEDDPAAQPDWPMS
jgi:hypothetical protein